MEIQRVSYKVGAMNSSMATPSMYTTVAAADNVHRYRMTYIPALLFGAFVSIFFAAALTTALTLFATKTISSRTFRVVDSLRLLIDCVSNFQDEKLRTEAKSWSNDELEAWAKNFMVRYETSQNLGDGSSPPTVVLTPISKAEGEG